MYNKNEKYLSAGITSLNRITFKNKLEFILVLLFSFNFLSCEAPRSNPIDPMNSVNSGLGILEGTVQTYSIPYTPLKDVSVHWVPGGIIVKTDSAGNFYIRNIEPVNGKLFIEKPGYTPDTITITWANSNKVTKQISLSRAPEIDSILMYTVVENQESSNPNSYLVIVLNINDIDNIIDSVTVQSPSLNVRKTLRYNFIDNNTYLDTLTLIELKVPDIERTTGFDFKFYIRDKNTDKEILLGTERITRVIKDQVNIISPVNDEVVGSRPELTWEGFSSGYNFTYMIEIYTTDQINPGLVKRITSIASSAVSYRLTENLAPRDYSWVVWIIDRFGNRSRSKPAEFVVQ